MPNRKSLPGYKYALRFAHLLQRVGVPSHYLRRATQWWLGLDAQEEEARMNRLASKLGWLVYIPPGKDD